MGCFDVVCALTNTPIFAGEKCHLVILRKDVSWDGITWLVLGGGAMYDVDTIFHGEYDDYGRVENVEGELTKEEEYLLETFYDHMHEPNNERKYFFVSDLAWQDTMTRFAKNEYHLVKARREHRELMGRELLPEDAKKEERENQIYRLMIAFRLACKNPFSGLGLFHQFDREDLQGIRENMELITKRLGEIEERYKEMFGDEDEEENQDVTLG